MSAQNRNSWSGSCGYLLVLGVHRRTGSHGHAHAHHTSVIRRRDALCIPIRLGMMAAVSSRERWRISSS